MSPIEDEVQQTAVDSRSGRPRRRPVAIGGAVAAVAIATGAIAVPLLTGHKASEQGPGPTPAGNSQASSAGGTPVGEAVAVYYLGGTGRGVRLFREFRKTTARDHVRAAVELMLGAPLDGDYMTAWPTSTKVRSVAVSGDLATVDLSAAALPGGVVSGVGCRTLQQLVWTVTAADTSIHRVLLSVEGRPQGGDTVKPHVGCGPDFPMTRMLPIDFLAPVQISTYNEGDAVRRRFIFGGEATVFEGVVSWSVVDSTGAVLASGAAPVSKAAPARGQWQANVVLKDAKIGNVVVLRAWEASAKDGSVTNLDTKKVTISR